MRQFLLKLSGLSVALILIGWLVFSQFLSKYYLPVLPFLLLFFFIVTLLIHAYQLHLVKTNINKFALTNMLIILFKLVLFSTVTVIYIATNPENVIVFVICLMIFYISFTFVEVSEILKYQKREHKK